MHTQTESRQHSQTFQEINSRIISQLEKGTIPWKQTSTNEDSLPMNLFTKKQYRGCNLFHLMWIMKEYDLHSPYFLTERQAIQLGGYIKKDCDGYRIEKWMPTVPRLKDGNTPDYAGDNGYWVGHTVFNLEEVEGLPAPQIQVRSGKEGDIPSRCEALIDRMSDIPPVLEGNDSPVYNCKYDRIYMPYKTEYPRIEDYYCDLFHEIIHSTGHVDRLARKELYLTDVKSPRDYSQEELTAEFGAAYLCAMVGIEQRTLPNSAAYISKWLSRLKDDSSMLSIAASRAQAAIDFLLPSPPPPPAAIPKTSARSTGAFF